MIKVAYWFSIGAIILRTRSESNVWEGLCINFVILKLFNIEQNRLLGPAKLVSQT